MFNSKFQKVLLSIMVIVQLPIAMNASELESEVMSGSDSFVVTDRSELASEELSPVSDKSDVESETGLVSEVDNQISEVTSEEAKDAVTSDSPVIKVEDKSPALVYQAVKPTATSARSLTNYTGTIDNRKNGTGLVTDYKDGKKTRVTEFKNKVMITRSWYYPNQKVRLKRTYYYNPSIKKYEKKQDYNYNQAGKYTDYKKWDEKNNLIADYDYDSNHRLKLKKFYDVNGKLTSKQYYKNDKRTERFDYHSNGKVKFDYNYDSKGVLIDRIGYNETGVKTHLYEYQTNGKWSRTYYYYPSGKVRRIINFDTDQTMISRVYYYENGKKEKNETWTSAKVRTKYETWNTKGLRTDYKLYYDSSVLKADYDYHSNGEQKRRYFQYESGSVKQVDEFNSKHVKTSYITYYTNGKQKVNNTYYSNGNLNVNQTFASNGDRTYYRSNYENGLVKKEYLEYYAKSMPRLRYDYTYYSNGTVKTKTRTDYSRKNEKLSITTKYNSSGRKTSESMSSGTANNYFKVPMKNGYITCQYGCYSGHVGIDMGNVNKTTPIYATAPGTVVQASSGCSPTGGYLGNNCNYGAGNYIVIKHTYQGRQYFSTYMHLSAMNVKAGDKVTASTKIGNMGNSGNSSGSHLHFEVFEDTDKDGLRNDEVRTNPALFVDFSQTEIKIW